MQHFRLSRYRALIRGKVNYDELLEQSRDSTKVVKGLFGWKNKMIKLTVEPTQLVFFEKIGW